MALTREQLAWVSAGSLLVVAVALGLVLAIMLGWQSGDGRRHYSGTATTGDFWTIVKGEREVTLTNTKSGETTTLPYVREEDDTYTIQDPAAKQVRFMEIPGYLFLLETKAAGANGDQEGLVIGIAQENLTLPVLAGVARPHLYFQFRSGERAGGEAGWVTFRLGSRLLAEVPRVADYGVALDDADQQTPQDGNPLDPAGNMGRVQPGSVDLEAWHLGTGTDGVYYYGDGEEGSSAMPIDFYTAAQEAKPTLVMTEINNGRPYTSTIFGTRSGQFVVDVENGSILCFAAERALQTRTALASLGPATFTALMTGVTRAGDTETKSTKRMRFTIADDGVGFSVASFDAASGAWQEDGAHVINTFDHVHGSSFVEPASLGPAYTLAGMFCAVSGARDSAYKEYDFCILRPSTAGGPHAIVVNTYDGDAEKAVVSRYVGAGIQDL